MGRGGGVSSRGRGKFKVARGGGRHFSRDLDPRMNREEEEESSEEESSEEEDSSDDEPVAAGGSGSTTAKLPPAMAAMNLKLGNTEPVEGPEMSRAERKALKKAQSEGKKKVVGGGADDDEEKDGEDEEESSEDELLNPHKAMLKRQAEKARAAKTPGKVVPAEMSRKDREAAEKKSAAERYAKLHAEGKTDQAKSDLARLQEIRRKREAAAAQRTAEADEAAKEAAAKKERAAMRRL